jgi:hypothetical protein
MALTGNLVKTIKLLAWREGDPAFVIQSHSFTLDLLRAMADSLAPASDASRFNSLWPSVTAAELTDQAGFVPYVVVDVPDHYYLLRRYVTSLNGVTTIVSDYRYVTSGWFADFLLDSDQLLLCQIASSDTYTVGLGDAPLVDVAVDGQPGVWIAQWASGAWFYAPALKETEGRSWDYQRANVLIWEGEGYTFTLHILGRCAS